MRKSILILGSVLVAVIIGGILVFMYTSNYFDTIDVGHYPYQEKLVITNVYTNATFGSVFVDVTSTINEDNIDSNITYAIIKDSKGEFVEDEKLSTLLLQGQSTVVIINCTLPSGNYTVTLSTTKGNSFVSPQFKIP